MRIGIIGSGQVGQALARRWAEKGHEIMFGSREPEGVQSLLPEVGSEVRAGSTAEAAAFGEVVVLAFPWFAATDIFREVGDLTGKVVIDCINPLMSSGKLALGHKTSAAEEIARLVPRARVIKAFNHLHREILADPEFSGERADAFYCSNDDQAKAVVAQLAAELGCNPVDAGPLRNARLLEPLGLFLMEMAYRQGMGADVALKLLRRDE